MAQITYADKVALYENNDIADINKVKADDMNEIKASVNNNDDMLNGNAVAGNMVVDGIRTKNMFNKNDTTGKLTYSSTGTTSALTDTFVQYTYIPVKPNTEYIFSMGQAYTSTNNRLVICEYDSSKTFIQRNIITPSLDPSGTGEKLVITTTSSTAYVRLCSIMAALDDLQFEEGNTRTTYTPFQNLNPNVPPTVLFSGNTTVEVSGTLTIYDDISNYNYIEIFYTTSSNSTAQSSTKVDVSYSKRFIMQILPVGTSGILQFSAVQAVFNDTTLTFERWSGIQLNTSTQAFSTLSTKPRVFKILGYK